MTPTLEDFSGDFLALFQARFKLLAPRVEVVPPEQVEILAVQAADLFEYLLAGVILGPRARTIREQVTSAGRDSRRGNGLIYLPTFSPFDSLVREETRSVLVGVRVVPRDGPVVDPHEGVFALGTPPRLPETAPDLAAQGFEHLCRRPL